MPKNDNALVAPAEETWLDRLISECEALANKVAGLSQFIECSDTFKGLDATNQSLLHQQYEAMQEYYGILCRRIEINTGEQVTNTNEEPSVAE